MKWISVKDNLPEDTEPIIIWVKDGFWTDAVYCKTYTTFSNDQGYEWGLHEISHWMIPEPPKDK